MHGVRRLPRTLRSLRGGRGSTRLPAVSKARAAEEALPDALSLRAGKVLVALDRFSGLEERCVAIHGDIMWICPKWVSDRVLAQEDSVLVDVAERALLLGNAEVVLQGCEVSVDPRHPQFSEFRLKLKSAAAAEIWATAVRTAASRGSDELLQRLNTRLANGGGGRLLDELATVEAKGKEIEEKCAVFDERLKSFQKMKSDDAMTLPRNLSQSYTTLLLPEARSLAASYATRPHHAAPQAPAGAQEPTNFPSALMRSPQLASATVAMSPRTYAPTSTSSYVTTPVTTSNLPTPERLGHALGGAGSGVGDEDVRKTFDFNSEASRQQPMPARPKQQVLAKSQQPLPSALRSHKAGEFPTKAPSELLYSLQLAEQHTRQLKELLRAPARTTVGGGA